MTSNNSKPFFTFSSALKTRAIEVILSAFFQIKMNTLRINIALCWAGAYRVKEESISKRQFCWDFGSFLYFLLDLLAIIFMRGKLPNTVKRNRDCVTFLRFLGCSWGYPPSVPSWSAQSKCCSARPATWYLSFWLNGSFGIGNIMWQRYAINHELKMTFKHVRMWLKRLGVAVQLRKWRQNDR